MTVVIAVALVGLVGVTSPADAATGTPTAKAAASGAGFIGGYLSETGTTEKPVQVQVNLHDSSGNIVDSVYPDENHHYNFFAEPVGSYTVEAEPTWTLAYESTYYGGSPTRAGATVINLADSQSVSADIALLPGASISGKISDSSLSTVPFGDVSVEAHPVGSTETSSGSTQFVKTDANGNYSLKGLSPGSYALEIGSGYSGGIVYAGQWYNNQNSQDNATSIAITQGQSLMGYNQSLTIGGTIGGTLTDTHGHPIKGTAVIYSAGSSDRKTSYVAEATVASDGSYSVSGLPLGSYKVGFTTVVPSGGVSVSRVGQSKSASAQASATPADATGNYYSGGTTTETGALAPSYPYIPQWYASHSSYATATVVKLSTAGQTYTKISAAMVYDPSFLQSWAGESSAGSNPAEKTCQACQGDPINTSSGEFYDNFNDLALPGSGPAVAVTRSYSSSNAATKGAFGYGWASNLSANLSTITQGNGPTPQIVQIAQENGSTVRFTLNTSGEYVAPSRVLATLSYDSNQQLWTFVRQSKDQLTFNASGQLLQLADVNGNTNTYAYNASGTLTSVSGSGGRSIAFTWSGGLVTGITDSGSRTVAYGYDTSSNLTSVTDPAGNVTRYGYDTSHQITTVTKPAGGVTTNTYDSTGKVTSQSDALGRVTSFAYSGTTPGSLTTTTTLPDGSKTVEVYSGGLLMSQTLASGTSLAATKSFTYDYSNNLATKTDPLGNVTSYTYDTQGNPLTQTDPLNHTTTNTYNGLQEILTSTDALSRQVTNTYDYSGNILSTTSASGRVQKFTYNADGTVASWVNGNGKTTTYGYDAAGNPTTVTDPDSRTVTRTYNSAEQVVSQADNAGKATTFTLDPAGRILTSKDPNGNITTSTYDADGNPKTVKDPLGNVTSATFNAADEKTSVTNARGKKTTFTYTSLGKQATTTDPNGNVTTNTYNALQQLTGTTDANKHTTSYTYDADNRLLSTTQPSGTVTSSTYDAGGNVTTTTDGNGKITTTAYDADNEPVTLTDPLKRVTRTAYTADGDISVLTYPNSSKETYLYDSVGNVTSFTNRGGKITTYSYDAADLLTSKTEPGNLTTSHTYTSTGLPAVTTNPDGTTTTASYDPAGQLISQAFSASAAAKITYTYDAAGRRTAMTDPTGTSKYVYDANGNLTSQTNGAAATTGYTYTASDQLATIVYPGTGRTVTYGYDPVGNMTSVTDWNSKKTSFAWTSNDQLATQTDSNGVTQTNTYDSNGQTTKISDATSAGTLGSFAYAYDAAGQLTGTTIGGTALTAATQTHTYDTLNQLTGSTVGSTTRTYSPTSAGLITTNTAGAALGYNAAQELTSQAPPTGAATSYSYDANGSRTTSTIAASGSTVAQSTKYAYSPSANLQTVTLPAGSTVKYTSDGDGLRQTRTVGTTTTRFTWDTNSTVALLLDDGTNSYVYGPSTSPIAQIADTGTTTQYLHDDNLGSPRLITSSTGAVAGTASYDDYGVAARTGTATTAIGYTGNWTDPTTGLVYLRARDYDPTTAQFITVDPALNGTHQPYAYVGNNPLTATDPTGLCVGMDGTPQDRNCTANDFFWAGVPDAIDQGVGVGIVGFVDGFTYGLSAKIDPKGTCIAQATDPMGYAWAEGVGEVDGLVFQLLLTRGERAVPKEIYEPNPNSFQGGKTLQKHYDDHGSDFGSPSPQAYQEAAESLLKNSGKPGYETKTTPDGVERVYQESTNSFGSYNSDGSVRTFFKPSGGQKYWDRQPGE